MFPVLLQCWQRGVCDRIKLKMHYPEIIVFEKISLRYATWDFPEPLIVRRNYTKKSVIAKEEN